MSKRTILFRRLKAQAGDNWRTKIFPSGQKPRAGRFSTAKPMSPEKRARLEKAIG